MLKSYGVVAGGVGGPTGFKISPILGLYWIGAWGFGDLRVWGLGLDNLFYNFLCSAQFFYFCA